jgi:hypothetical protein
LTTAAIQGRLICSVDNTYDGSESLIKLGAQIITYWQGLITLEQLHTEASAIWVGRLDDVFEFCTPSPLLADYKKHKGPDGKIQFTLPFVPHPKATRPIEQGGYSLEL